MVLRRPDSTSNGGGRDKILRVTPRQGPAFESGAATADVNEPPVVSAGTMRDFDETETGAVHTFAADDPEEDGITWSRSGDDKGDFSISADGELSFGAAPDFESPADENSDNVYEVTVQAFDGTHTIERLVTVTVLNVEEPGTLALSAAQPRAGAALTATLEDPDRPTNTP